ncbi:MAG: flagellar cap protein FliD N-terminal domain-containing protein, partial [Oscillospiraceae bacterium]
MNNIGNSNYFSASRSSNKGMSGLASGMDTENMVKQMLAGTQAKIDKQNQLKQQAEWKQTIYRDVISSINSFR